MKHHNLAPAACTVLLIMSILLAGSPGIAAAWASPPGVDLYLPLVVNRPGLSDVGHLLISEVMYDPDASQGSVEWIEILNPTGDIVQLADYKIGDEETLGENEGMYRFPAGAVLGVGQTAVIAKEGADFKSAFGFAPDYELSNTGTDVPDMIRYAAWAGGSVNLTNAGDEVLLLDVFDDLVDAVSWGSSNWAFDPDVPTVAKGHTIERVPAPLDSDSPVDWIDQAEPSPGTVTVSLPPTATPVPSATSTQGPTPTASPTNGPTPTPVSGGVLISEVMYDSNDTEPAAEWIEILNVSGTALDISGFRIGDEETENGTEGMYIFPSGSVIPAGEVVVIANQGTAFQSNYGFKPDFELNGTDPLVPDMEKYTAWSSGSITLSNTGDEVLLMNPADQLVDAVSWGSSDWAFSPPAVDVPNGHSLERFPTGVDTDTAADWQDQAFPNPGDL